MAFSETQARQEEGEFAQAGAAGPVPGPEAAAELRDRELHRRRQGVFFFLVRGVLLIDRYGRYSYSGLEQEKNVIVAAWCIKKGGGCVGPLV